MAEVAGKTNIVYILTGSTAMAADTGDAVLGTDNSTYSRLCNLLDISSFGDDYVNRLAGMKDTKISLSGNYYASDTAGQDELVEGDTVFIGVYPSGIGSAGYQVKAIVESYELSASATDKQTFSASLLGIALPVALPAQS